MLTTTYTWLAGFADAFGTVVGVVLSLCGLGLLLMGLVAVTDREWRHGGLATVLGLAVSVAGLWLVGVISLG